MKLLKRTLKTLKKEAGQALPMALVLLLLGGLLVVPTIVFMNTNLNANRQVDESNLRLYAADAGIQFAQNRFLSGLDPADPEFLTGLSTDPINGCNVSVNCVPVPGEDFTYQVTSIAENTVTGEITEIDAYFQAQAEDFETAPSPFSVAVATLGGNLTLTGSSKITSDCSPPPDPCYEGDVWVNGDIIMGWSNQILGTATVTGTTTCPAGCETQIPGGVVTDPENPPTRPEWLDDMVDCYIANTNVTRPEFSGQSWNEVYTANTNLGWGTEGTYGSVHATKDLTISGTGGDRKYTFTGPVWVEGNLKITSGANYITFQAPVRVDGHADFGGTGWVKFENPASDSTISYGYHAIGTEQGSGVYIAGEPASVLVTSGNYGTDGEVIVKLQDSDDGSIWTDVTPCGTLPKVTELNDNGTCRQNYTGAKPYLRAVATVTGAACQFGVGIVRDTTLHIGKYLNIDGSRSAWFDGPVVVNGGATTSSKIVNIGGSKYSGLTWDIVCKGTLRAVETNPNCDHKIYLGGSKVFQFWDVVYTNVSAEIAGATGSNMSFTKAFIVDCDIDVSGSSQVDAPPTTSPIFVSRFGDVDVSGATLVDAIVYAPEGNVHVSGSSQLEGAIMSESALLEGAVTLKYPVILRERDDIEDPGGGTEGPGESIYSMKSYSIH
jgi:hypothetical protein